MKLIQFLDSRRTSSQRHPLITIKLNAFYVWIFASPGLLEHEI